jgi:hypothetical protein
MPSSLAESSPRHAQPCAGHPCLSSIIVKDVDGRDKPGHDEYYCESFSAICLRGAMPNIRISLFADSYQPFCEILKSNQIEFTTQGRSPGAVMAAASLIEIFSGVGAILAPLATVLVAWIRSKSITVIDSAAKTKKLD